jgi:predicted MPP superfamily phosphohydrolase
MNDGFGATRPPRERRASRSRRTIELVLDTIIRPGHWAAKLTYPLGLQGRVRSSVTEIRLSSRPAGAAPLRLAFASDFHAGGTTDSRLLAAACEQLAALEPDVLLLGGDFVSVRASYIDQLAPALGAVPARFGKFAVLGNHDLRADHAHIVQRLEHAGIEMLTNRHVTLATPFDDVSLCGLDDPTHGWPDAGAALDGASGTRIVLMHSPEGLRALAGRRFDLALCGHTHGGQIAAPWGQAILLPSGALNRQYTRGWFELDGGISRTMLVSRGVGCSTVPVRIFAAPEVHLCLIV